MTEPPLPDSLSYLDYDSRLAAYAVIVDRDARVLLALWNEGPTPKWTMPGGGVDLGETVEHAVVREVKEETGYDVALTALLGVDTFVLPAERRGDLPGTTRPFKSVRVVFLAAIVGGDLRHEIDGTTDEARWISLADVPGLPRVSLVDRALDFYRAAFPEHPIGTSPRR